jgi:hypothetical protein
VGTKKNGKSASASGKLKGSHDIAASEDSEVDLPEEKGFYIALVEGVDEVAQLQAIDDCELEHPEGIEKDGDMIYDLDVEHSTHRLAFHWLADDIVAA